MPQNNKNKFEYSLKNFLVILGIIAACAIFAWFIWNQRHETEAAVEETSSSEETEEDLEEQTAARLATLLHAQENAPIEVVPMQFFVEETRPEAGLFRVTAVTTMPEKDIADVSFHVTAGKDREMWYDGISQGNGRYVIEGSAADLGHADGVYRIEGFITPDGGDETEAGVAEFEMELADYFYSEALGEGRQSLVLVHPDLSLIVTALSPTPDAAGSTSGEEKEEGDADVPDEETDGHIAITEVLFKVWTEKGEQDDILSYPAVEENEGIWSAEISLDDYFNKGDFVANAYAVTEGKEIGIASERFELLPDPVAMPEGDGTVVNEDSRVYVEVPEILQLPELPTGCESVALTIVLNSLGYELEKTTIATDYLTRGDNLATTYVGDPFSKNGAGCFPPAIVLTANKYLKENKDIRRGHEITGTSMDELCAFIDNGIPVILWSTSNMAVPTQKGVVSTHRGKSYEWYSYEHCLVLYGYDREKGCFLVSDPLEGLVERNAADFEKIYDTIGRYAAVIY